MANDEMAGYRDLVVWQRAIDLVALAYELMKLFLKYELYGMCDQIRRTSVSVPANIAEGQARRTKAEFTHYLGIARGSLAELDTLFEVAHKLTYVTKEQRDKVHNEAVLIRKMIQGLLRSLK